MGLEEELLRIAKKLEKMVARKKTVRLQSLQRSPGPRRRDWASHGLGGRAGPVPEGSARDTGLPGRGVPPAVCWPLRVGVCVPRSGGHRTGSPKARGCCKSVWMGRVRSWAACAEQRKHKKRYKPGGGHLGVWELRVCSRPGELQAQRELEGHILGDFDKDRRTSG